MINTAMLQRKSSNMNASAKKFDSVKKALKKTGKAERVLLDYLKGRREIVLAYLFGSFVEKQGSDFSDIDIAVVTDDSFEEKAEGPGRYGYASLLSTELSHLLKYPEIDLSILNQASPLLQKIVISKGKLIYARSEKERIAFETAALSRYADTEPLRRIKRRYMEQRMERGLEAYARPAID
jgi:predicted nucleotidyltransferase